MKIQHIVFSVFIYCVEIISKEHEMCVFLHALVLFNPRHEKPFTLKCEKPKRISAAHQYSLISAFVFRFKLVSLTEHIIFWFVSDRVDNPEIRVSCDEAHLTRKIQNM